MNLPTKRFEFPSMLRLQERMNRLFDDTFNGDQPWELSVERFVPAIDVIDAGDSIPVKVEVPGIDPKDIQVSLQNDVLTITGEKKAEHEDKGKTWYRREASYGKFSRSMTLPSSVMPDKILATGEDGVLTIQLPKSEATKARQIEVKTKPKK